MSKTINPYFFLYFILISLGRCISVHHISEKLFWSFSSYSWCRFSFALFVTAFRFLFRILPVLNEEYTIHTFVGYQRSLQKILIKLKGILHQKIFYRLNLILRIQFKLNTALLSYCPCVRVFVTGVTSHISHIYKGINAMLIIRGPIKPYIFWIKIILANFLAKTRPDKTIFSALTNLTIEFDFELSKM